MILAPRLFHSSKCARFSRLYRQVSSMVPENILSPNQIKEDHAHCVDFVKGRDREGYLCGLLMPSKERKAYFALRAFNVELASVKDGQLRPQAGDGTSLALQLRMQWWSDAIGQIYGEPTPPQSLSVSCWHSPIVRSLYRANQELNFTRSFLERLIESRRNDLDVRQYRTLNEMAAYAEDSFASLLYLSLETLGVRDDKADEVAFHAGVGLGLTTALRSIPHNIQVHGNAVVPENLLPKASTREVEDFVRSLVMEYGNEESPGAPMTDEQKQKWQNAVEEIFRLASHHLSIAQQLQTRVPREGRSVFLPLVPAMLYLSHLQTHAKMNVFDASLNDPSNRRLELLLLLGRTWMTGVF